MLAKRNFLLGQRSPAAQIDNSVERGEHVQVQDVDALVSCWILPLLFDQPSTGSQIGLPFAAASFCWFSRSTCDFVPIFPWFVRAAVFLHAHVEILHSKTIFLHNLRIAVSVVSEMVVCGLRKCAF